MHLKLIAANATTFNVPGNPFHAMGSKLDKHAQQLQTRVRCCGRSSPQSLAHAPPIVITDLWLLVVCPAVAKVGRGRCGETSHAVVGAQTKSRW